MLWGVYVCYSLPALMLGQPLPAANTWPNDKDDVGTAPASYHQPGLDRRFFIGQTYHQESKSLCTGAPLLSELAVKAS
jgi:hypothetical protein